VSSCQSLRKSFSKIAVSGGCEFLLNISNLSIDYIENPMLHVPTNIRQIPSPMLSPVVEQKGFIPQYDNTPIVVENVSFVPDNVGQTYAESPAMSMESPSLTNNIVPQQIDPQVSRGKFEQH
jgi:hypothetical protein